MPIQNIHTFIVYPKKGSDDQSSVNGAEIELSGKMFDLLQEIYQRSEQECDVEITFMHAEDGRQQNDCRDLICSYLKSPSLSSGRPLAERLQRHTDARSGMGLLFLICGHEGRRHKLVLSRFPTDNAIYVEENKRNLSVEFLERVFMKNRSSYKSVLYIDGSLSSGLWSGRAIDKQLNNPAGDVSHYWIRDFLHSQLTVTAAAGTRRLAAALKAAMNSSNLSIKQEIAAAAKLAPGLNGQYLSIDELGQRIRSFS